ncbi:MULTISPECIES: hypothetical protein [Methylobacterium]|uniref:Uncharacterized protein n=1 Tax=Methylobacterium thuringiense TaxID=1003091 RepID=A0ABQ4TQA0_9HYPH|nr:MULTISPECIES: hypothetical protein [Methylobacterium]TXN19944.1 hypothetical protein FV217_19740 [Methylobacterium sp. WL9]GJE56018.1 hypothetical protein EKPJFOCH_2515 [Methylobacterium thuringiense]
MKSKTAAALGVPLLLLSGAASAQSGGGNKPAEIRQPGPPRITTPGEPATEFVKPGGGTKSGPGSVETQVRGGTGADSRSSSSAADGNAEKPELPVGNTGGGGGSGAGGG